MGSRGLVPQGNLWTKRKVFSDVLLVGNGYWDSFPIFPLSPVQGNPGSFDSQQVGLLVSWGGGEVQMLLMRCCSICSGMMATLGIRADL